tara:strand:+ start:462 stop:1274 length:813 start_codon:yes stop_codon:yes gene_type:complete
MNTFSEESHYFMFLEMFGSKFSFQTFDDKVKNKKVTRQLHGSIKEHFQELSQLNAKGAGVFFTVNETDLMGRSKEHIKKVRAVFIDLDGTPLPDKFDLEPHCVVNTSKGKYHVYWLVDDMELETFTLYQQALAVRFNSDPKVKDLSRVMRIPGFYHYKKDPYPIKILSMYQRKPYKKNEIRDNLKLIRPEKQIINHNPTFNGKYAGGQMNGASEGDRHEKLVKMLIAITLRGESYDYLRDEAIKFADSCNPPEDINEVLFQAKDIWKRYS